MRPAYAYCEMDKNVGKFIYHKMTILAAKVRRIRRKGNNEDMAWEICTVIYGNGTQEEIVRKCRHVVWYLGMKAMITIESLISKNPGVFPYYFPLVFL